jgi:hypothetical protein
VEIAPDVPLEGPHMLPVSALPRSATPQTTTAARTRRLASACAAKLPREVQQRWQEVQLLPAACAALDTWRQQAPAGLAGVDDLEALDLRLGELWAEGRLQELDEVMCVLLGAVKEGAAAGEAAFLVLVRRLAAVLLRSQAQYRLSASYVLTSFWLVTADYPLQRRPRRVAANLAFDLRKRLIADLEASHSITGLTGLSGDIGLECESVSRTRFVEQGRTLDPARLVEGLGNGATEIVAAVDDSSWPAADLVDALLKWAEVVIPDTDVELLRLVFGTGASSRTALKDVALQLGVSPEAVRQRLPRALRRLSKAVTTFAGADLAEAA